MSAPSSPLPCTLTTTATMTTVGMVRGTWSLGNSRLFNNLFSLHSTLSGTFIPPPIAAMVTVVVLDTHHGEEYPECLLHIMTDTAREVLQFHRPEK